MRNYIQKKHNPNQLPHNLYMQMLYLIRDYESSEGKAPGNHSLQRLRQWEAVRQTVLALQEEYDRRPSVYGVLEPLRAFFDYAYFSMMFTQRGRDMGASKRCWNLYRCRFAYLLAKALYLF